MEWKCDVCGKLRPDDKISVHKMDLSRRYSLPEGTICYNAKFCNDNPKCVKEAPKVYQKKL